MSVVTDHTIAQFVAEVSQQQHAMAGAVIAASAAQAAALGQACVQISQVEQDLSVQIQVERLTAIKSELLNWCDRDASAIAEYVALRDVGETLAGQRLLCSAPATASRLSIEAAQILQDFRPLVSERVHDDLEMSIGLLAGAAQAALLLLDSNLRIWEVERPLLDEFEPILADLLVGIDELTPVKRIRSDRP
jgi:formiminotetrahydrofolate cyclodeaminase